MSNKMIKTPMAAAVGVAFLATASLAPMASAEQANPFAASELSAGYDLASKDMEGKCGGDKTKSEGKCGGDKAKAKAEGKCGEGKCGGDKMKAKAEGKCGGDKMKAEGKCGGDKAASKAKEGKCGGDKSMKEGSCGGAH